MTLNNPTYWILALKPYFVAVFSTEELLLNGYPQLQSGQDIHFLMDASYGVLTERQYRYIPVKIGALTQMGHTVAYAIVTKENGAVHGFLTRAIIASLEAVDEWVWVLIPCIQCYDVVCAKESSFNAST